MLIEKVPEHLLTMFDLLLVRDDVEVSEPTEGNYSVVIGPPIKILTVRGASLR